MPTAVVDLAPLVRSGNHAVIQDALLHLPPRDAADAIVALPPADRLAAFSVLPRMK